MITKEATEQLEKIRKEELRKPDYYAKNIKFLTEMLNFIMIQKL